MLTEVEDKRKSTFLKVIYLLFHQQREIHLFTLIIVW